ncbi:hypothetical protein AC1031_013550 [Aphanomyces cochlioides]|nr:hypothetical protein AC1031_013550 [Aphanomyces cochlioides]
MKYGTHVKKLETEAKVNEWLVSIRQTRVYLSIYKYGNEIVTKDHLAEFSTACIAPRSHDRSGAPNDATIQEFVGKLHVQWDDTWEADHPIWRIWATHVVRPPLLAWESRVRELPPPHVLAHLRPKTVEQQARIDRFQHNIRTAMDVVDGALLELQQLNRAVDVVFQRIALFQQALVAKREILRAMEIDLAPLPANLVAPSQIDNVEDEDHDFTIDDME